MRMRGERGIDVVADPQRVEASLWRRLCFEADTGARERLFGRYVLLARSVAARHWRRRPAGWNDRDDVEQLAYEGLIHALDRFDPLQGVPFGAFARPRISGNVLDGIARHSDIDSQLAVRRQRVRDRVRSLQPNERADPLSELADLALDLALGLLLEGTGLIEPADGRDHRHNPYEGLAWRRTQAAVANGIEQLPEREAAVIRQHYQTGLSFAHIATLLQVTRGRVSQLHRSAIESLRRRLSAYRGGTCG